MTKITSKKSHLKVKQVTLIPKWLLKVKGRFDAKTGSEVCNAYIERLQRRLHSFEADETIRTEQMLYSVRTEAKTLLKELAEKQQVLENLGNINLDQNSKDPSVIRLNRANSEEKGNHRAALKKGKIRLCEIDEEIISTHTVMDERVLKLRSRAAEKVYAYVEGIRRGGIKDYKYEWNHSDEARKIYHDKHDKLDQFIHQIFA